MAVKIVLMVMDDDVLFGSLRESLAAQSPDIELVNAPTAQRALGMMELTLPAVLVVDADMTGDDAYAFTQQIKTTATTSKIPIVLIALEPNEAAALKARQAGASAYLPSAGPVDALVGKIVSLATPGAERGLSPGSW